MLDCTFLLCAIPFLTWKHRTESAQEIATVVRSLMMWLNLNCTEDLVNVIGIVVLVPSLA